MTWYEKNELRKDYEWLYALLTLEVPNHEISYDKKLKMTEPVKRKIRENLKIYNNREDNIHYSEDGESCWWKEYFDSTFTEEEKQEFIEDRWVHIYEPWSPTGKWFTRHIAVCNLNGSENGKAVAYFFMGLDV